MVSKHEQLMSKILDLSESNEYHTAIQEWAELTLHQEHTAGSICECGHNPIYYKFTVGNIKNGNILYPIGSSCIKKFRQNNLTIGVNLLIDMQKLKYLVENNRFIKFSSELFSRNMLKYMAQDGAFQPNKFNQYNPTKDYEFMLKVFNARELNDKQRRKCTAILMNSIIPYLKNSQSFSLLVD